MGLFTTDVLRSFFLGFGVAAASWAAQIVPHLW